MASCGNPTVDGEPLMSRRLKFDNSRTCVKCKINDGNIVIRHAVYCKDCFMPLQTTKFKRLLEPSINPASSSTSGPRRTKLKATGNLMIGLSGGLGSTVLLDLVSRSYMAPREPVDTGIDIENGMKPRGGTKHPRNQNVWKQARVCYVEMSGAFPESGMQNRTEEVRKIVEMYEGFEFVPSKIEDAFDSVWWEEVGGKKGLKGHNLGVDISNEELLLSSLPAPSSTISPLKSLQIFLTSLPTETAIKSTLTTLTRLILLYTALSTSSSHLLLGTTLTGLSVGLISGIAMGGGFVVREEAGEEWLPRINGAVEFDGSIRIVRPLKDMGMKECAAWVWWNGLEVVGKETAAGGKNGIGELTKNFIVGLERDYPSTVSTIARTCAKLTPKDAASECCAMCERPAQRGVQDWKARISIRSFDMLGTPPHIISTSLSSPSPATQSNPSPSLTPHLCYACHTAFTSRSSRSKNLHCPASTAQPLPVWVSSRLCDSIHCLGTEDADGTGDEGDLREVWQANKLSASDIKDVVKDFLLDESTSD